MNELEKLESIREKLVKAKKDRDILTGKLEALTDELKELGYDSTKDANLAIDEISKTINKDTKEFNKLLDKFDKKYPDLVSDHV